APGVHAREQRAEQGPGADRGDRPRRARRGDAAVSAEPVRRVAVGADDHSALVDALVARLEREGSEVVLPRPIADPWVDVGTAVGEAVASGRADLGVVVCWTGTGVSIAANKVPGVRAALCVDAATADGARR